jgi:hypothetical protein
MTDSVKLRKVVTTALKDGKINSTEASKISGAITYDNKAGKLSPADVKLLQKVASLPDTRFEDKKRPDAIKSQRDELREYASSLKDMQGVKFAVKSSVPGIEVKMSKDFAVVDLESFGYQHEKMLQVTMKDEKARASGHVTFEYGKYKVNVEVKKGQDRDTVVGRIESALLRQQEAMTVSYPDKNGTTTFNLHRFKPLTAAERKERLEWMSRMDAMLFGGPGE